MKENKKQMWRYLIGAGVILLLLKYSDTVFSILGSLRGILTPVLIGLVMAYILNIIMEKVERIPVFQNQSSRLYRVRRPVSILASLGIIMAVIVLIAQIIIPELIQAINVLVQNVPIVLTQFTDWLANYSKEWPQIEQLIKNINLDWPVLIRKTVEYLTSGIGEVFSSTFLIISKVGGGIVNFVIASIFAIYILAGKEKLFGQVRTVLQVYLKKSYYEKIETFFRTAHVTFTKFIIGQCTEAVILGGLCTIGMLLFRFPYATMIGTLVGATALLPIVGAYLGAFVGAFMIMTISPVKALGFLIFIVVLQQLEGNLIYPKVVGFSVGLSGLWVLAAVIVGGGIGGIGGMLIGVPLTATIYKLLGADVRKKKKLQETQKQLEEKKSMEQAEKEHS